jgi:ribosomal protein S6E (S10)
VFTSVDMVDERLNLVARPNGWCYSDEGKKKKKIVRGVGALCI